MSHQRPGEQENRRQGGRACSGTSYIVDEAGDITYDDFRNSLYEFVDDNDDLDRSPDWFRSAQGGGDNAVFPGWDENNDFVSDFNQNDNRTLTNRLPDYEEPFFRYHVDRPEFLFGIDLNNNNWIDRFENDDLPDYPYKTDHRGYNVYFGGNMGPYMKLTGGRIVFVLFTLWAGRRHLKEVWRKTWQGDEGVDDSQELLSYRVAVFGFLGSLLVVGAWLWRSGIPLVVLPLFLAACLIFYIMVTRVVATSGVATARSPMVAAFFVISSVGTSVIGSRGLVALTLTYVWQSEMRVFPMIAVANGLKIAEIIKGPKRRLFWGMIVALLCSLVGATWIILYLCYEHGGINLNSFFMTRQAVRTFTDMARPILNPRLPDVRGMVFTVIGGAIEWVLIFGQHRFFWWPFHPMGYVISVGWLTSHIWFVVFLTWLLKLVILKYGGVSLFKSLRPMFLGMILGEAAAAGMWIIIYWLVEAGVRGTEVSIM